MKPRSFTRPAKISQSVIFAVGFDGALRWLSSGTFSEYDGSGTFSESDGSGCFRLSFPLRHDPGAIGLDDGEYSILTLMKAGCCGRKRISSQAN